MGAYIAWDGSYHEGDALPGDRPATASEVAARLAASAKAESQCRILSRLTAIDAEAIRPLRAIAAGTGTEDDMAKIAALEAEAESLRAQLAAMS